MSSALDVISKRIKEKSKPKERKDSYKVGLVLEGGCMRSVVTAGMTTALQALQGLDAIDAIYSSSAGSCVGAYFSTNQGPEGTSVFYKYINNSKFINPLRVFIGKQLLDLHYMLEVFKKDVPLNCQKIIQSKIPNHIFVTEAKTVKLLDMSKFSAPEEVLNALFYTCQMPIAAGWPTRVSENIYYTDGAILAGVLPLQQAIKDKCTHILVLPSRPIGSPTHQKHLLEYIAVKILSERFPKLAKRVRDRYKLYAQSIEEIKDAEEGKLQKPEIEAVHLPKGSKEISGMEKRSEVLLAGAKSGFDALMEQFKEYELTIDPEIKILE